LGARDLESEWEGSMIEMGAYHINYARMDWKLDVFLAIVMALE